MEQIGDYLYLVFIIVYAVLVSVYLVARWFITKIFHLIHLIIKRRFAS